MELNELSGEVLAGRFELGPIIGQGGYGAVFEATQLSMGRRVAIKVLRTGLLAAKNGGERFRAEAYATSKLTHPNSVVIYDFGEDEERGLLFLAMEFLEGMSLNALIKQKDRLTLREALEFTIQIAHSLQDAHDHGIVHRDVKPHNVMVVERGGHTHIKVIDFGIAKVLQETTLTPMEKLTQTGVMVGTPQYMAPEQIRGESVDGRTDVYALAICVYKMLLGRVPFSGGTPVEVAVAQLTQPAPSLRELDPDLDVSPEFEEVLARALHKDVEARWPTTSAFAHALVDATTAHEPRPAASPFRPSLSSTDGLGPTLMLENNNEIEETAAVEPPSPTSEMESAIRSGERTTTPITPDADERETPGLVLEGVRRRTMPGGEISASDVARANTQEHANPDTGDTPISKKRFETVPTQAVSHEEMGEWHSSRFDKKGVVETPPPLLHTEERVPSKVRVEAETGALAVPGTRHGGGARALGALLGLIALIGVGLGVWMWGASKNASERVSPESASRAGLTLSSDRTTPPKKPVSSSAGIEQEAEVAQRVPSDESTANEDGVEMGKELDTEKTTPDGSTLPKKEEVSIEPMVEAKEQVRSPSKQKKIRTKKEVAMGQVSLVVNPGALTLWIDGKAQQRVARTLDLPVGTHRFEVEYFSGARSTAKRVRVRADKRARVEFIEARGD